MVAFLASTTLPLRPEVSHWGRPARSLPVATLTKPQETSKSARAQLVSLPVPKRTTTTRKSSTELAKKFPIIAEAEKPGVRDAASFLEGTSVAFWQKYKRGNTPVELVQRLQSRAAAVASDIRKDPITAAYWMYCLGRTLFFLLLGLSSIFLGTVTGNFKGDFFSRVLGHTALYLIDEASMTYEQDLKMIRGGVYKMPWDMNVSHRQFNAAHVARESSRFLAEALNIGKKIGQDDPNTDVWVSGKLYPDYYAQTFHYQTDGWMSSYSADIYDINTETLFSGRQDAMQRITLSPISEYMKVRDFRRGKASVVVEIGAGTGRFSTFVRDNWPGMDMIVSDLSPFYLQKARENMAYWERSRRARPGDRGSVRFMQARAEDLALADSSVDILYSVNLFHELPPSVRKSVAMEAARVLKPGGLFVMTDSIQLGDRPTQDHNIMDFETLNEP